MPTDTQGFLIRLGASLVHYGAPAQRVEQFLEAIGKDLGIIGTFSATPTLVMMDVVQGQDRAFRLERVRGFTIDLQRLEALDRLANEVARGERTPSEGLQTLETILTGPPRFGPWLSWLSFVVTSGPAAAFFGGGWIEVLLGAIGGGALGLLCEIADRRSLNPRLVECSGAFVVALVISLLAPLLGAADVNAAILGGIIVLVPGFSITIGVSELVTHHVTAGVSRLGASAVSAMMLGSGVVFGLGLGEQLVGRVLESAGNPVPQVIQWAMVPLIVVAVSVLFRAPVRQWGWITLIASAGFGALSLAQLWVRPELAVFIGALVLGCGSNLHARLLDVPSGLTRLPGLLFLVPGTLSYLSITGLMGGHALDAVTSAGQVGVTATALVTGLIIAGSALPPRKLL
jgi:uncharacterized membrane protein YjjP (DUF1212 family)